MKIRLEENTLRVRLDAREILVFQQQGRLETVVCLGLLASDQLTYTLERAPDAQALAVACAAGTVRVLVPTAAADAWTTTGQVSLQGAMPVFNNQVLQILVEKDLGCKH
ncbi:hypothetical protein FY528_03855 [Hymenobacter lutimineralis]|uniref:Uncharacterized protein n=1 Tax=Hymenobacter lutimineralis TaxID=2606448 RepID=A0A5D6VG94_9BACT|nr:hypothetical protein [Hymenobacter lutimineralis]TYZ13554.1 hypothetical protein FY528_03855 [Hymenobacter lutimineralis]